jgi:hypothetical protein
VWLATLALTLACGESDSLTPEHEARAREALQPFKKELLGTLMQALPGGASGAVETCQAEAPRIAIAQSAGEVAMGRTSHRLRNSDNAPEDWMKPLLTGYVGSTRGSAKPAQTVIIDTDRFGYVEPIYVNTVCMTCHGNTITQSTRDALAAHYPDDQATGFAEGEFRGIFWVTMPIDR